ncbi:MAG: PepSY domain-containing protein [Gemmatimonadota bacterium]
MLRPIHVASIVLVAAIVVGAGRVSAQSSKPMKEEKPGLLAKAKITPDAARSTALARIKGGAIKEEEIEQEDGKLVFSFDIAVAGKTGIEEVLVDAVTGKIVSVEHESPADQSAEAAKDAKDNAAKAKGKVKKPGTALR